MRKLLLSSASLLLVAAATLLMTGCEETPSTKTPDVDPILEVDLTPIDATAAADKYTIAVKSNGNWTATVQYSAVPETEWISLTGNETEGDGTIEVNVDANTAVATREATIVVTMGELEEKVALTQAGANPSLSVDPPVITDVVAAGTSREITVTSNTTWTATEESDFISLVDPSGNGNGVFTITVAANTTVGARNATVTVTPAQGTPQTITITQLGIPVVLEFNGEPEQFPAEGESKDIAIAANIGWTVSSSQTYATVSPTSGTGDGTISVTFAKNEGTEARTATLTLTAVGMENVTPVTMEISQGFTPPIPSVTVGGVVWATANLTAEGTFGATVDEIGAFFQFNSKIAWPGTGTITDLTGWTTVNQGAGNWLAENDPCPDGWHVPTQADFNKLTNRRELAGTAFGVKLGFWYGDDTTKVGTATVEEPNGCLFFPTNHGYRNSSDAVITGQNKRDGYYWSATGNTSTYSLQTAYAFLWEGGNPSATSAKNKNFGGAVRCVKNAAEAQ